MVIKTTTSVGSPFPDTHGSPTPSLGLVSLQAWALANGPWVEGLHSASQPGPVRTDTQFHIALLHSPVTNTPWPKQYGGAQGLFDLQFQMTVIHFWEVKAGTQTVGYTTVTVKRGKENASMQPDCLMEPGFFTQTKAETVTHPGRQLTRKLNGWEAHSVLETQPAVFSHLVSPNPISVIWAVTTLCLGDTRWSVILSWNLNTWKVKGERVWGQLGLYSEILFQKQVNNLTSQ